MRSAIGIAAIAVANCIASGCTDSSAQSAPRYTDGGDRLRMVFHEEHLVAGLPMSGQQVVLRNPFEGDARAIATGKKLFVTYNCVDCHGADGAGAMAPTFQDGRWHFGGSPSAVFESIYQGRPEGMPSWGGRITNDQIWMLTSYVRSLPVADFSTENFSGATVERAGH